MKYKFRFVLIAFTALAGLRAWGQNVSYLNAGTVEFGAFGGFAGGLGRTAAGAGANFAVAANRWLLPYFEFTYFPDLLNRTAEEEIVAQGTGRRVQVRRKNSFSDFHGGIHLRVPFKRNPSVMPYFAFGVGGLRKNAGQAEIVGGPRLPDPERTDLAVNFGGGLRWYARQNVGIRIEAKGYKPNSDIPAFNDPFMKITFGVFYIWGR
ncbi:MAG: hypothetical protein NZV14_03510 [Bryobacteraceae bacterium]|nr:hypothetical protein [Bryobacteraceae bacterium]MDW8377204.1 hypothetical protein [Bryobacterales bacterium]